MNNNNNNNNTVKKKNYGITHQNRTIRPAIIEKRKKKTNYTDKTAIRTIKLYYRRHCRRDQIKMIDYYK